MNTVKDIQVYIEEAGDKDESIQLPVVPASFSVSGGQNNVVVNITSLGDANLPGKKAAFFPLRITTFSFARDWAIRMTI